MFPWLFNRIELGDFSLQVKKESKVLESYLNNTSQPDVASVVHLSLSQSTIVILLNQLVNQWQEDFLLASEQLKLAQLLISVLEVYVTLDDALTKQDLIPGELNSNLTSRTNLQSSYTAKGNNIHHGSTSNGGERKPKIYEFSQEIMDKQLEMIVRKYGKESFKAASVIQKAFRNYQLHKRFKNLALNALRVNNQEKDLHKQQQQSQQQQQQHRLTVTGGGSATSIGGLIVNDFVDGESSQSFQPLHQHHVQQSSSQQFSESKLTRTSSSSAPKGNHHHHNQQQQQHLYHHHPNFHPNGFSYSFNNNISNNIANNNSIIPRSPTMPSLQSSPVVVTDGGNGGGRRVVVKSKVPANTNQLSHGQQQQPSSQQYSQQYPQQNQQQHLKQPQHQLQYQQQQSLQQQQQQQTSVHVNHGGSMKTSISATSFPHRTPHYDVIRAREYRVGLNLFNKNPPERGIQYLFDKGFIDDIVDESKLIHYPGNLYSGRKALRVATFLLTKKGLSKQMIGEYLGDLQSPFNQLVLKFFVREIDFTGMMIDVGLRKFQTFFRFPGEAQKIERLVETFAERYCECNEGLDGGGGGGGGNSGETPIITNKDDVFILSFAIIMLNTDLHVPNNKRRMTVDQWIKNLRGVVKSNLTEDFLIGIYERIKLAEMKTGHDHCLQVLKVQASLVASSRNVTVPNLSANTYRRLICFCRLHEIVDLNKKERQGQHQREVFLFNDLLLVTKVYKKGGGSSARTTTTAAATMASNQLGNGSMASQLYSYRKSILLTSVNVSLFSTHYYPYGIKISSRVDKDKTIILFNARNDTDRFKFFEDLKESIAEMHQMEMIRIQSTMGNGNGCSGSPSPSSASSSSAKRLTVNSVGTVSSSSVPSTGNSNTLKTTSSSSTGSTASSSSSSSSSSTVTTNATAINSSSTGNLPSLNHSSLMDLTTSSNSSSPSSSFSSPKSGLSSSGKHQGINKVSVSTSSLDSALPNSSSSSKSIHHLPPLPTHPSHSSQSTSSSSLSNAPEKQIIVANVGVGSIPMTDSLATTLTTTHQSLVSSASLSSSSSSSSSNQQLTSTTQHINTNTTHYV